jgi:hypothetical protein
MTPREPSVVLRGHEVRGILDGRQTQLRRVLRLTEVGHQRGELASVRQAGSNQRGWRSEAVFRDGCMDDPTPIVVRCPFGAPGGRLWVKEGAIIAPANWTDDRSTRASQHVIDNEGRPRLIQYLATAPDRDAADDYKLKVTPSIHVPRWAARLTLEVTAVRVERLCEISEEDARAEGVDLGNTSSPPSHRGAYAVLWDEIHGPGSWNWNPWVWAISFRRVTP